MSKSALRVTSLAVDDGLLRPSNLQGENDSDMMASWELVSILGPDDTLLAQIRDAKLYLSALGIADFDAIVTTYWKPQPFIFRLSLWDASKELEVFRTIGQVTNGACSSNVALRWSNVFHSKLSLVMAAKILPGARFDACDSS